MKIYRPLWTDGAFLSPQQFQQQARWDTYVATTLVQSVIAHPWGVIEAEFDSSALNIGRLNATKLKLCLPDGTLIDTVLADNLPSACDLAILDGRTTAEVVIALPLLQANGANLAVAGQVDRPVRFLQEWVQVQDLVGYEQTEIAVQRYALSLRFAHDENSDYITCPVARLNRNSQGVWELDSNFIPPMLAYSASQTLLNSFNDFIYRLQAKRTRLMAMRRESNERLADFAVADVSLFWLLNALNSSEPVLIELQKSPNRHPELFYREMVRLAGSLLTFSLEHRNESIPNYDHQHPEKVFPPLLDLLKELLETSLPSRVITIELLKEGQFWKGSLNDSRLREEADFYLSVRSNLPAHLLISQLPLLCKVGSPDEVADVVNVALSGVPLRALSHVPAAIPLRLENQYFALELNNPAAEAMLASGYCAFYTPGTLGDLQLELFAVLRS